MISIISGTSREGSIGRKVAGKVADMHEALGEEVNLIDLNALPKGAFEPSAYGDKPAELSDGFVDSVLKSDGLVIVVPEYNGSYPGILKHFIDLLPFPESFDGRPVAFIGLAGGYYGGVRAVEQLQMIFAYRNAFLFNRRVFIPNSYTIFNDDGELKDSDLQERLELQASTFQAFTKAIRSLS
jgi:NAD(P)H-dependent FMN reductase